MLHESRGKNLTTSVHTWWSASSLGQWVKERMLVLGSIPPFGITFVQVVVFSYSIKYLRSRYEGVVQLMRILRNHAFCEGFLSIFLVCTKNCGHSYISHFLGLSFLLFRFPHSFIFYYLFSPQLLWDRDFLFANLSHHFSHHLSHHLLHSSSFSKLHMLLSLLFSFHEIFPCLSFSQSQLLFFTIFPFFPPFFLKRC